MTIEVEGPDGAIHEFPDGTAPKGMKSALARHYGARRGEPAAVAPVIPRDVAGGSATITGFIQLFDPGTHSIPKQLAKIAEHSFERDRLR